MLLNDAETELAKQWLVQKLEKLADADSDVLADYVLALVKTDEPDAVAKVNTIDNLKDFLGDASDKFVDEVFAAIADKSYDPSRPRPPKVTVPAYQPSQRENVEQFQQQRSSKKRSYVDWDGDGSQKGRPQSFEDTERPMKQPRRAGRGGFDQRGGRQQQQQYGGTLHQQQGYTSVLPPLPTPPAGMPPFDPNDPMSAFLAMQQAMGMGMFPPSDGNGMGQNVSAQRCRDYDNKGYCSRGASCPYEHGNDLYVVPNNEYDPTQATLLNVQPNRKGVVNNISSERGRAGHRGRGSLNFRGGGKRSEFSHQGPNHNKSITTIVVEQIPEDKFDEEAVRAFFGQFGTIEDVNMQSYKRLAVVKFDSYDAAKAAYDSPKVIFDNRFVKVYWSKAEAVPSSANGSPAPMALSKRADDVEMRDEEPQLDPEELARKQEDAQRKHDEQKRQREEADHKRKELDEKMKALEANRKKMAEALAKKTGAKAASTDDNSAGDSEQTKALKAQLARLEAEAKSLGIDPHAITNGHNSPSTSFRGRGGFRGRGRGRGGYIPGFRDSWTGARGGAVMRLDNRPKTVCVAFKEGKYQDHDEPLRQWLLFNGSESATLTTHPTRADAALVAFEQRYLAETFMSMAQSPDFPLVGKAELTWYKPETASGSGQDTDMKSVAAAPLTDAKQEAQPAEDSYDVADDDDRWG